MRPWIGRQQEKPFDVLAEGHPSGKSRGDWAPLELFVGGVRGWEAALRQQVRNGSPALE